MTFRVGMKVVCVRDDFGGGKLPGETHPVKNAIYTIRAIEPGDLNRDLTFLQFNEIVNPCLDFDVGPSGEANFDSRCFRPAVERKTSIEIFKKLLTPNPELEEVR